MFVLLSTRVGFHFLSIYAILGCFFFMNLLVVLIFVKIHFLAEIINFPELAITPALFSCEAYLLKLKRPNGHSNYFFSSHEIPDIFSLGIRLFRIHVQLKL